MWFGEKRDLVLPRPVGVWSSPLTVGNSVADPDPFDPDPDPAFHFDTNPDPVFQFDTDPDPYHFREVMYIKQYIL